MFIKLAPEDIKSSKLKGVVDGKSVSLHVRLQADDTNIEEAIKLAQTRDCVVSVDYIGTSTGVQAVEIPKDVLVIVTREGVIPDEELDNLNPFVRYVCEVEDNFSDMELVYNISQKHPNVFFNMGHFLALEGCNIGSIRAVDIGKVDRKSKNLVVYRGDASVFPTLDKDMVTDLTFFGPVSNVKEPRVQKEPRARNVDTTPSEPKQLYKEKKPKTKKVASFISVSSLSGVDNF